VVLSHDIFNRLSGTVITLAIISQPPRAGFPLALELTGGKLPKRSWEKSARSELSQLNDYPIRSGGFRRKKVFVLLY
jgi:hypothetical protein